MYSLFSLPIIFFSKGISVVHRTRPCDGSGTSHAIRQARVYAAQAVTIFGHRADLPRQLRIVMKRPSQDWPVVSRNLPSSGFDTETLSIWFIAIHDFFPTCVRLHTIRLQNSDICLRWQSSDTLEHRLSECAKSPDVWRWTVVRIAAILHTDCRCIPTSWLLDGRRLH